MNIRPILFRPRLRLRTAAGVLLLAPCLVTCTDSTAPLYAFWEGTLNPVRPSFVSGRVIAVTQHGKTDIGITMENGEPGLIYGWRVDSGSCQEPGQIQGGPTAYPPLLPNQGGSDSAETSVAPLFRPGKQFAARVFLTPDGGGEQVVACGDLEETTG